jgi:hypothetical protein
MRSQADFPLTGLTHYAKFPLKSLQPSRGFTWPDLSVGMGMSFTEPSENEVNRINKHFPNRSAREVKQAIEQAKASFHGTRTCNRLQIIARILNQP